MNDLPLCERIQSILASQMPSLMTATADLGACIVATPILGPDNSGLTVVVAPDGNGFYRVTDDGAGADFLFLNGVTDAKADERGALAARRFGFEYAKGALTARASEEQLARTVFEIAMAQQDMGIYRDIRRRAAKRTRSEQFSIDVERAITYSGRFYERNAQVYIPTSKRTRTIDFRILPKNESPAVKQLALFLVSGESEYHVGNRTDVIGMTARDIADQFEVVAIIDSSNPALPIGEIVRGSMRDIPINIVDFQARARFEALLESAA